MGIRVCDLIHRFLKVVSMVLVVSFLYVELINMQNKLIYYAFALNSMIVHKLVQMHSFLLKFHF